MTSIRRRNAIPPHRRCKSCDGFGTGVTGRVSLGPVSHREVRGPCPACNSTGVRADQPAPAQRGPAA